MPHRLPSTTNLRTWGLIFIVVFCADSSGTLRADVRLPKSISDHMILQKSDRTAVWGWAAPDEDVRVTLDTQSAKTKADADGKWKVALNLGKSAPGPFQMTAVGKKPNPKNGRAAKAWMPCQFTLRASPC